MTSSRVTRNWRGIVGTWCALLGPVVAGIAGIALLGMVSWPAVRGVRGILMAAGIATLLAGLLPGNTSRLERLLGAAAGGTIGGFFAIASAEQLPPGTWEWALKGGGYGIAWGFLPAVFTVWMVRRARLLFPGKR